MTSGYALKEQIEVTTDELFHWKVEYTKSAKGFMQMQSSIDILDYSQNTKKLLVQTF